MNKSYFVSHTQDRGFWSVLCNDAGHYRTVARYRRWDAAFRAAQILSTQTDLIEHVVLEG